ncbi:hypothetical protein OG216_47975 (plasmid) [Streptomycetaceae bacterium NBC_01309]
MEFTWVHDLDAVAATGVEHRGGAAGVLPGGVVPTYTDDGCVREREWRGWWTGPRPLPAQSAAALRPVCVCGWRGTDVPLSAAPSDDVAEADEDTALAQWWTHIEAAADAARVEVPLRAALDALDALAAALGPLEAAAALSEASRHATRLVDEAVADAAAARTPWSRIGEAIGTTRQGAHDRYKRRRTADSRTDDPVEVTR